MKFSVFSYFEQHVYISENLFSQFLLGQSTSPPRFLREPSKSNEFVSEGETIVLQCSALGVPQPEYMWLKNGEDIFEHYRSDGFFRLPNSEKSDAGEYQCLAKNSVGAIISRKVDIEIAYLNDLKDKANTTVTVRAGVAAELLLPITDCNPEPKVDWKRVKRPLSYDMHKHRVTQDKTLIIFDCKPEDSDVYYAQITNPHTGEQIQTGYIELIVQPAGNLDDVIRPQMIVPPKDTTVTIDSTVVLECITNARPVGDIQTIWKKDGNPLLDAGITHFLAKSNQTLTLMRVSKNYGGVYECQVKLRNTNDPPIKASATVKIQVTPPFFTTPMKNVTVIDGKDTQIACSASGAPLPNTTWIHNGTISLNNAGRHQILKDSSLLIASVEPKDAGRYSCIRSNSAGSISGTIYVSVLVRTQIVQPPSDTKVILSSTATLQCKVSHDPLVPYQIYWYINDRKIDPNQSQRINLLADGTLEIREARNTDVGSYTCSVISPGGNETRTARLDVVELPYAPTSVSATLLNTVPKTVKLIWSSAFDGNSELIKYIIQQRVIPSTGPEPDIMLYWLTKFANVSAAYNRNTPSSPPIGVVGSARSATSIMIQWQPPSEDNQNGILKGYIIRYKLAGYKGSPWSERNLTNENQRNFLLQDLIIWKNYEIQVAAYNGMGVGKFSQSIFVRTREGVPQASPDNVKVSALNSTAIQVWWDPPLAQFINGINQGYKVQAWKIGKDGSPKVMKFIMVDPNVLGMNSEHTAILEDLEKFTNYNISVLCFTSPGDGPRSTYQSVKTLEDVPDAVATFRFKDILDRSVYVYWSPPVKVNGILTGYTLKYNIKGNQDTIIVRNLTAEVQHFLVTDLLPSTAYIFEIYARTDVGNGKPQKAIIRSGVPPVLPETPSRLAVSNISPFSVVLQFTPGFDGNTSITKWIVEAQVGRNVTWTVIYKVSTPDATTISVSPLIPFTEYRMRLIATNVVGASNPSEPTKVFQTIQSPPSYPPYNVTVRAMSATALRVRWTPLQSMEWHGIPRGYNVSYRRLDEDGKPKEDFKYTRQTDHNANSFVLNNLEEFVQYEVGMQAYNDVGSSPFSPLAVERTRESTPSAGPQNVEAEATSSTTIVVKWAEVNKDDQNGIIEGYRVYYGAKTVPFMYKTIESNSTFTSTLTELKKFVLYRIQVLAYTRIGDGELSMPPIAVKTFEDVPGVPSNIRFPDVSKTTARIIWEVPEEPNGEIIAYKLSYHLNGTSDGTVNKILDSTERTLKVITLHAENYYMFSVSAQTGQGWGKAAYALVYTSNNREVSSPPTAPKISSSQIQAREMTFSWTLARDGFAPIRFYSIQQAKNDGAWMELPVSVDPTVTSYTVKNLNPVTKYRFKIQATNDIGPSGWSLPSEWTKTLPTAPEVFPKQANIIAITTTSIKVSWKPLDENSWNGDPLGRGYKVEYCLVNDYPIPKTSDCPVDEVHRADITKLTITNLIKGRNYEVKVYAFNQHGDSPPSPPMTVYVGEAVPMGEPLNVVAKAVSSTEIKITWDSPPEKLRNGELHGYKVFYLKDGDMESAEQMDLVPASPTQYLLIDLEMFTKYRIHILAFNPAGDGPRSKSAYATTREGIPGRPGPLKFSDITMTSLNVSWSKPEKPNGRIRGYLVTYKTTVQNDSFTKQVTQTVNETYLVVEGLRELVTYKFQVKAQTYSYGLESIDNVTTGPQEGSPDPVINLISHITRSSMSLSWTNGSPGKSDITGYIIESRKLNEDKWKHVINLDHGPTTRYTISFQNLVPSTNYNFRAFTRNSHGISAPTELSKQVFTPAKFLPSRHRLPFYREVWFLVTLAAISLVIIIMVISILCVKSKSYKYKHEAQQKTVQDERMSIDDGGFATFELRQSKRGTLRRNTLSRKSATNQIAKSPPRPSPGSITYSDDEDNTKGYDDNCDSSSLTEKPSEISSTDSQASESDVENEPKADPHSFVNHYANVNDTFRQSWKRQRPARIPSYTDSEHEGSISMSLNGGQIHHHLFIIHNPSAISAIFANSSDYFQQGNFKFYDFCCDSSVFYV
ncbi:Protein sidekick [Nymphon striatum]|nr:Protein sidekick [Nymphon striatum]